MKKKLFVFLGLMLILLVISIFKLYDSEEKIVYANELSNGDNTSINFSNEFILKGEGFILEDELMRYPFRIRQSGKYLYVLDLHGEEHFCHIYNKEKLTHIASFAKRGNGPKEVLQAINLHVLSNDSIYLFDTGKKEISLWDFSEEDTTMILKQTYKMKDDIILSSNCTWCSDTTFFFTDKSGENRILKCNRDGEIIDRIGRIPIKREIDKTMNGILARAWNSYLNFNPEVQILAIATQLGDVFEIYNIKNNTYRVIYGPKGEPEYKVSRDGYSIPTGIMGYGDIQVTSKYIYAVFNGRSFKEIMKDPQNTPQGGENLLVYDHNGAPICKLKLDHSISGIHIDEESGIFWATDVNSEEQIVLYEIPKQLL